MLKNKRSVAFFMAIVLVAACINWFSCEKGQRQVVAPDESQERLEKPSGNISRVMDIQDRHTKRFLSMRGVVGTATARDADGSYAIKVLVRNAGNADQIPEELENVPVMISVVGEIRAEQVFTGRYRPVKCGVSGGSYEYFRGNQYGYVYDGGTIGCVVKKGSDKFFLSNNHVIAHSNSRDIGDAVVQPGLIDVGGVHNENDIVAHLYAFKTIRWHPLRNSNVIDAAIAKIIPGIEFTGQMIAGYTPSSSPVDATLGMDVKKCGRTTGLTYGTVTAVNVTIVVSYLPKRVARFDDQVEYTKMSDSGDSGSLVVTADGNRPVALHFAGGSSSGYGNPIGAVLDYFGVSIVSD